MNHKNKKRMLNFILVAAVSFVLLFTGVRFVLENSVTPQNIMAYVGLSLVLGLISTALYLFNPKIAYWIFNLGVLAGFIMMYRTFLSDLSGWEDLSGLISLFLLILLGLAAGLVTQLVHFFYQKYRRKQQK